MINKTDRSSLLTQADYGNGGKVVYGYYDAQGRPAMVNCNGSLYTYELNLQGDVVRIVDSVGTRVVEYKYDAWGRKVTLTGSLSAGLGKTNPFRYRGYIYDEDTQMYYLRSRYYSPELQRFISADRYILGGLCSANLYAYCKNTPVMNVDPDGNIGIIGTALASVTASAIVYSRQIVSDAADAFLKSRGWTLTNMLFQQSLWGGGQDVTDASYGVSTVKKLIANDSQTFGMIKSYAEQTKPGTTANYVVMDRDKKGYQYTKGDRYYALQHVNADVTVTKNIDGSWNALVHITDRYNFDEIRWGTSLGDIANNGGLFLQTAGLMSEYDIDITVKLASDGV